MMKVPIITWPENAADARAAQQAMQQHVSLQDDGAPITRIAGIDVSYDMVNNLTRAVVVMLDAKTLAPCATPIAVQMETQFPYIPGLLSFREIPAILKALSHVKEPPDLLMVDGHGIAHPRRLGIAAHLGVLMDMPAIGVAKKKLVGSYTEPGTAKGESSPLWYKGERIGTVLRSKDGVKPLFISPGHRISQERTVEIVQKCLKRHKLPEPTRLADAISKKPAPYML
jgi:deoxyribonuclease V